MNDFPARFLVTALLFRLFSSTQAEQMVLSPSADTSLFEFNPTNNLGGYVDIPAGTTREGKHSRGLMKFDVSAVPANATITAAALTVQVVKLPSGSPVGSIFALHRMLRSWGEGNKNAVIGAPADPGEATWEAPLHPSPLWTTPGGGAGGDYATAFSATNFVNAFGPYTFGSTPALVADVQAWVSNPATNFGWMLLSQSEAVPFTARRFGSHEDMFNNGPKLSLTFTTSTSPQTPKLSQVALVGNQFRFTFNAESNRTYAVEFRSSLVAGGWSNLTNIAAQPAAATISIADAISGGSRFYRVKTP